MVFDRGQIGKGLWLGLPLWPGLIARRGLRGLARQHARHQVVTLHQSRNIPISIVPQSVPRHGCIENAV